MLSGCNTYSSTRVMKHPVIGNLRAHSTCRQQTTSMPVGCNMAMADMSCQTCVTCKSMVSMLQTPKKGQIELTMTQVFSSCSQTLKTLCSCLHSMTAKKHPSPYI